MQIIDLNYVSNSHVLFAPISKQPWAMLLDSGSHGSYPHRRFDIIVQQPFMQVLVKEKQTEIYRNHQLLSSTKTNPFITLKTLLAKYKCELNNPDIPFCGGAVGYFAYDLIRQLENLTSLAQNDLPFADMAIGIYDWAMINDHLLKKTYIVAQHFCEHTSTRIKNYLKQFNEYSIKSTDESFRLKTSFTSNLTQHQYHDAFKKIQHYLHTGDCYEVNFAQRLSTSIASGAPWPTYQQLQTHYPAPFSAYLNIPQGALLCFSPERFLKVNNQHVLTQPIKGTIRRGTNSIEDDALKKQLYLSEKNRAENMMIVDLMRNDLSKCCVAGSVKVTELFGVYTFANVHHLISSIEGQLKSKAHAVDILQACFPGGSITGAPKIRAMEIIEELEPHRRSLYCGSVAYISFNGNMDSNIIIRSLLYDATQQYLHCYGGGAIVADSGVNDEYRETLIKINCFLNAIFVGK